MSLKKEILSGVAWSGAGKMAGQAVQFSILVFLARLLRPSDFGLMAMVLALTGFVSLFAEMGLASALIQKKDLEERHRSSIFWFNIAAGAFVAALVATSAPLIARFYEAPQLVPMLRVVAINFVIGAFCLVQSAILTREMAFRKINIIGTIAMTVAGVVAIVLAYRGFGVWSLVWQSLASSIVLLIGLWFSSTWRPGFLFEWQAVKELFRFGGNLVGFNFFNYWVRNLDNILVGRYMGPTSLGLYSRAYGTMGLPLGFISAPLGGVMFPALSSIQDDKARVKSIYLQFISTIALLTFPMMLGMLAVSQVFVLAIFGEQWRSMAPLLQIFCLVGMVQSIGTTVGWIYMSQGKTDLLMRWGLIAGIPLVASIVLGVWIGSVKAVAICYSVAAILAEFPSFVIAGRLIGMTLGDVVTKVAPIFLFSSLMAAIVWLIGRSLPDNLRPWQFLAIQVFAGIVIYSALLEVFSLDIYLAAKDLLLRRLKLRTSPAV
jgi:O-antigen/teichoic acid export membrane protein